ncbi:hypothetical protein [uncultured Akkermansia sp.]|uniref:hypothetical protein n=2 Tax=uncultured Akkermansia sp. TaxID=512294 RepID=UPI002617081D|nr:hypothetical protein [uncultured Akkermansia sp.]
MLNFLGMTRHLSTTAGYAKRIGWLLFEDVTQSPFPVTGVSFTGVVKTEQGDLPVVIEHGEQEHCLELTFPALPVGRWPYAIHAQDESGEDLRLFSGYIGAVDSVAPVESSTVYDIPAMGITIPVEASKTIKAQWLSNTASIIAAQQAQQNANTSSTNAETASQAAKTATDAAATAAARAEEAEGYAGSAWASKNAAADSATAAGTSATNAARDAKSANAAKTAVESLATTWPETVSNGEKKIVDAGNEAVTAIQDKQADSVLAVGRASQTAQQNIAGARTDAVAAVQTAQERAVGAITPLVQRAETAKEAIDQAEGRINTAATNAANSATSAGNSATAAANALAAIPQVDESGNMTLPGNITAAGGTFDGTVNANGGINIPLAVGAPTNESGVNRLYASGLAAVTEAFSPQSFLSDFNLYGESVAVEQTVPGQVWRLRKMSAYPGTIQINLINPFLGVSNYSGWSGFVLPVALGNTGSTAARKLTFSLGRPGNFVKKTAAEMDMFTLSPASGSTASFPRFVDVTFYMVNDASMNPAGYPVRVRELVYDSTQAKWLCYETLSVFPSTNTNPSCNMFLSYQQDRPGRDVRAGLWIGSNAADSRRLLCIADMHGVVDTFSWTGVGALYWDSDGTNTHSYLGAMRQMTAPGYNQPNGAYDAFRALETRLIQSTTVTEFTPYE